MRNKRKIIEFGELEGERSSTVDSPNSSHQNRVSIPATEVSTKKRRRRFTKEYKLAIPAAYSCVGLR